MATLSSAPGTCSTWIRHVQGRSHREHPLRCVRACPVTARLGRRSGLPARGKDLRGEELCYFDTYPVELKSKDYKIAKYLLCQAWLVPRYNQSSAADEWPS